jgi:hypothetical protein
LRELIDSIKKKHQVAGIDIFPSAPLSRILSFEKAIGFALPSDFKEFYSICDGFSCNEDIFNMISLGEIMEYQEHYGNNWFHFSEYMIYSDMWGLRVLNSNQYEIFNDGLNITLTSSLSEFLQRFLYGNVFETGGLYDWQNELKNQD